MELSRTEPTRYHKIAYEGAAIESLLVTLFLEAQAEPPKQIILDLDATDDPLHGHQEGRFFHGYYDCYCVRPDGAYHQRREDPSGQTSVWSGS